jgi:poly(3-hydroxybutyrate) depolymerase
MKPFGYALFALWIAMHGMQVLAQTCNPAPKDVAILKELRPEFFTVEGPLAEFDPCHKSVKLQKNAFGQKQALMIEVHGGGGVDSSTKNAVDAFRSAGFATLVFDAYELNGFYQGFKFWGSKASNEARQRMIYKAALGAYAWAIKNPEIDQSQIYFHGLSNGANVVANLAGAVDPKHVKGIFAEGLPGMGLGLPDKINVPVRMVSGRLDNYGGTHASEWIWLRRELCLLNVSDFIQPPGNSAQCNGLINRHQLTPAPIDWLEDIKSKGADIEVWYYENAAHGIFFGSLQKNTIVYGTDMKRFAWVGADASAKAKLVEDVQKFAKSKQ